MILLACMLCTGAEAQKIHLAQTLINKTLPTACFANKMAEVGVSDYWINQLQGADKRLEIRFYREESQTVGWTYLNDNKINLNRKFHDGYTACQSGSNIAHELAHTLGYAHFVDVAYATNYAFSACCPK